MTEPTIKVTTIGEFRPQQANPNKHTQRGLAALDKAMSDVGYVAPMTAAADGEILDGSARLETAALRFGDEVIVIEHDGTRPIIATRTDVPDAQSAIAKRISYAANQVAALDLDWDVEQIAADLEAGVDLAGLWSDGELAELLGDLLKGDGDAEPQIDKAAELQEKWQTATGQMWQLNDHRIICGDCTDPAVVARVMGGEKAALAPVDPPYNVGFDYDGKTVDDAKQAADYEAFSRAWFAVCQSVSERQIVTPGGINHITWVRLFDSKHCGVWIKTNALTRGRVSNSWCWEPVFFFGSQWSKRRANDVFDYPIGEQGGVANHPCPKPLKLWCDLIDNYSQPGDVILDCFDGSGTTIIACERLHRKARACEISPGYVAVAIQRWCDVTNGTPVQV